MSNHIAQFREAIRSAGLIPPDVIEPDGKIHRYSSNGKRGDDAGWYSLHEDGIPAGSFGDWRSGLSQTWRADIGRNLTPAEEAAHRARIEASNRERENAEARERAEAAIKARDIWQAAKPAPENHPYLKAKGIQPYGARIKGDSLVIPMRGDGDIQSLQFIAPDGDKRFMTGSRVTGCYFSIGNPKGAKALCIAEGFATGASVHEATGYPVAVAFNAGNLVAVAQAMREMFPDLSLILCADDDAGTAGNPGITKATEAALSTGGLLAVPVFTDDLQGKATDFNDMAALHGLDAVKRAIEGAKAPDKASHQPQAENAIAGDSVALPILIRASDVESRPISWLWHEWIAGGKLHIIGGAPGLAKTTIALALAATVSTGGRWPDGTICADAGDAVIWSGEDGIADTLKPRLEAMGANLERVHFIGGMVDAKGKRPFDPATDMNGLLCLLEGLPSVKLVIVDPIVSAVAGDSHKNAEVRRGLQPLVDFGENLGIAVIGITHFSKGTSGRDPLERLTGSLAFGALARLVFGVAKLKDDEGNEYRAFVRIKSNIGHDGGGFRYEVDYVDIGSGVIGSRILWGEPIEGAAREILRDDSASGDPDEQTAAGEALLFVRSLLADAPMRAGDVQKEGRGAGFSDSAIRRAADKLKVIRHKEGMRGGWIWKLPPKVSPMPEDAEDVSLKSLAPSTPSAPDYVEF